MLEVIGGARFVRIGVENPGLLSELCGYLARCLEGLFAGCYILSTDGADRGPRSTSPIIERQPDPDDQRSRRITLTQRGLAIVPVIRDAVAEIEQEWRAALG